MQIKPTMRYHLTPVRMAIFNQQQITSVGEDVEKREASCAVGGKATGAATMENSMKFPQKIKSGAALWPSDFTYCTLPCVMRNFLPKFLREK